MVRDSDRTSNGRLCPLCPLESFEHVQNFPPDGTDINRHHRTRNGFAELETDIKQIRMDTNGLKEVLSVSYPYAGCDRNFRRKFSEDLWVNILEERLVCILASIVHIASLNALGPAVGLLCALAAFDVLKACCLAEQLFQLCHFTWPMERMCSATHLPSCLQ